MLDNDTNNYINLLGSCLQPCLCTTLTSRPYCSYYGCSIPRKPTQLCSFTALQLNFGSSLGWGGIELRIA